MANYGPIKAACWRQLDSLGITVYQLMHRMEQRQTAAYPFLYGNQEVTTGTLEEIMKHLDLAIVPRDLLSTKALRWADEISPPPPDKEP